MSPHVALLGGVVSVHMAHTQADHLARIVHEHKPVRRLNRKLVRDNIPHLLTDEWKAKNPRFYPVEELSEAAQKALWLDKLREELGELVEAVRAENTDKALEEALDLSMFLSEFATTIAPDWNAKYNKIAGEKYKRNGGVTKHLVMEYDE